MSKSTKKNGAPSSDVIAPTGKAVPPPILLAKVSEINSNKLPVIALVGRDTKWLLPSNLFTI